MTKCLTIEDFDTLRVGDISPDQRQLFQSHIAECDTCREEFLALQQMDEQINAAHQAITPRDVWIADMQALLHSESAKGATKSIKLPRGLRIPVGLATAAILLMSAILGIVNLTPAEKQTSIPVHSDDAKSTTPEVPQLTTSESDVAHQDQPPKESVVLANGEFLVGRHPSSDNDIELYWILPINRKQ
jgi:anti-sigma factor RsiW